MEGVVYDALKHFVGAAVMTLAAQYVLKHAFNKLKKRQEVIAFCGGSMVLLFLLFTVLGSRPEPVRPKLIGSLQQAVSGLLSPASERDTVFILSANIINTGTMQTIVKNWKVSASAGGNTYDAVFMQMPPSFTFNKIPQVVANQPDSITFKKADDIVEKALTPIQVGALLPGIIFVVFQNVDQSIFKSGVTLTVTFEDVLSTQYSMTIQTSGRTGVVALMPGLKTEYSCPVPPGGMPKIGSDLLKLPN